MVAIDRRLTTVPLLLGMVLEEDDDSGVSERRPILWIAVDADRVVVWLGLDAAWRTSLLRTLADAMVSCLLFPHSRFEAGRVRGEKAGF